MQKRIIRLFVIGGLIVGFNSCMSTKQYSVNQKEYLGVQTNPITIYTNQKSNCFYSPLNMNIFQMDKLMLVDFKGDSLYETIELQVYNDSRGKGATVILYGKNGEHDIFYTDSVFANLKLFKGHTYEDKNLAYLLNITNCGLDASIELKDRIGRIIKVKVKEKNNYDAQTSFLAPIGSIIKTFTFFPMFYMENFDFVKCSGTSLSIHIDNKPVKPKKIPILLNGSFVYLARYSAKPVICGINDSFNGELKPMVPIQENKLVDGNITFELNNNNGHFEINKINCNASNSKVSMSFSPAIPDLVNLAEGVKIFGKFSTEADSITGIVAGTYQINRVDQKITFQMNPLKAYSPIKGHLWVLSYQWTADISINSNDLVKMDSNWVNAENTDNN